MGFSSVWGGGDDVAAMGFSFLWVGDGRGGSHVHIVGEGEAYIYNSGGPDVLIWGKGLGPHPHVCIIWGEGDRCVIYMGAGEVPSGPLTCFQV